MSQTQTSKRSVNCLQTILVTVDDECGECEQMLDATNGRLGCFDCFEVN